MRQDVFNNLVLLEKKELDMTAEAKRYLQRLIRNGRRNGTMIFYLNIIGA